MKMNSKAEAHVKRAQLLLGHSQDATGREQLAFGRRKRRKKIYTTPMKTNEQDVNAAFYYLHYTKEQVLRRLSVLYKMFKRFEVDVNCLLLMILHGSGSVYNASVPLKASDMLFIFNLSFVLFFLEDGGYRTIIRGDDLRYKAIGIWKQLHLEWYISFLERTSGMYDFVDEVLFFHSKYSPGPTNQQWHFDGEGSLGQNVSDVLFFACTPEPKAGCGTRICRNLPETFRYPSTRGGFLADDDIAFLEKNCDVLETEHLHSVHISNTSNSLHRGLLPKELRNTTRLFMAFEEKYDGVFQKVADDMDTEMQKHGGSVLVLSSVPQYIHQELESLVFDLMSSKRVRPK